MALNYIPDTNPFHLAGPPDWFLRQLWDFDNSLVIVPSRQGFYYRLAQRRKLNLSEKVVNDALFKESDTQMLATYSLVPVTTIMSTANWGNPYLFVELAKRAPWRMGGADAVNKMLDEQDRKEVLDKRKATDEHLTYLAKDAWKYYGVKTGTRTSLFSHKGSNEKAAPAAPGALIIPNSPTPYRPLITTSWGK